MTRRRRLRPDEEEVWQAVARTATPLHPKPLVPRAEKPSVDLRPPPQKRAKAPKSVAIEPFRIGEKAATALGHHQAPGLSDASTAGPLRMDAKAFARMSRGKLVPEARIDLHGMTLAEAHPALISFIMNAHSQNLRLVLVITGKGKERPSGDGFLAHFGAIRRQVPQWLGQAPMAQAVLQVAEAHLRHGGGGACYVYLKRQR